LDAHPPGKRLDRRAPSARRALKRSFAPFSLPALGERLGDFEADVVAAARVLAAGIAEPDYQPVDRCATAEGASQGQLLLLGGALRLAVLGGALALSRLLADDLRLGLDFLPRLRPGVSVATASR